MKVDQVLAAIDALIDDQLAEGEPETGYESCDGTNFPRCRCGGTWHGLATGGCPGSDAEGPQRPYRSFVEVIRCRCGVHEHDGEMFGCPGTTMEGPVDPHGVEQQARLVEAMRLYLDAFRATAESIERSFRDEVRPLFDVPARPSELRVQLPRPATTPPMWAVDPTRARRRRSHQ